MIPADLETAISSMETFEKIKGYWLDFKLNDDQQKVLGFDTGLYMLGKTKESQFAIELSAHMNVGIETAELIKKRIDAEIIAPVRASFELAQKDDSIWKEALGVTNAVTDQSTAPVQKSESVDEIMPAMPIPVPPAPIPEAKQEEVIVPEIPDTKIEIKIPINNKEESVSNIGVNPIPVPPPAYSNTENKPVIPTPGPATYTNTNYEPLNIIKDADNGRDTLDEEGGEDGTELDNKLDQILKKARVDTAIPARAAASLSAQAGKNIPPNLPTDNGPQVPQFNSSFIQNNPEPKKVIPKPVTPQIYQKGSDPYREPIE